MNVREWALPVYTILMQLAVGALVVLWVLRRLGSPRFGEEAMDRVVRDPILVVVFTAAVAMLAAHFHLSRPLQSYMAVMNFKTSWLSREIFFSAVFFWTAAGLLYLTFFKSKQRRWISLLGWLAVLVGTILVYCMANIYLLPTQVAWNSTTVIFSFYVTGLMLGANSMACLMVLDLRFVEIQKMEGVVLRENVIKFALAGLTILTVVLVLVSAGIVYVQISQLSRGELIARTSLRLLLELYLPLFVLRLVFLFSACLLMGISVYRMYRHQFKPQNLMMPVYISCLMIIVGEIIGRFLFYATHIRVGL